MSAFLCNPAHIGILSAFVATEANGESASRIARTLAKENLRSVEFRYPDTAGRAAEEFLGMTNQEYIAACAELAENPGVEIKKIPPQRLWGMAQCSDYQSCEHPEYKRSRAAYILRCALLFAASKYFREQRTETGWEWSE